MAVNKVVINTENGAETIVDLTGDSVNPAALAQGYTAHDSSGKAIEGTMPTTSVLYTQQTLTNEQRTQARYNIDALGASDVVNDLVSFSPERPLSAEQGAILKEEQTHILEEIDLVASHKADVAEGTFFVQGGGTTDGTANTSAWTGTSDRIRAYYDGLTIRYKIGVVGESTTTLNINGLGAKTVYRFNTTKLTTQFPVGSIIHLTYHTDLNGGCWMCNDYDANTNTYQRLYPSTGNTERILV